MRHFYINEWYKCSYAQDISSYLKERELYGRCLKFQSPELQYRDKILEWVRKISEKFTLSNVTVHLGVFLIDKFMDNHSIEYNRLRSVALTCLILAAKFEEQDCRIPKLYELPPIVNYEMQLSEFVQLEIFILHTFDWRISWPTAAHFGEYYLLYAINSGDSDSISTPKRHLRDLVISSLRDFLDITLSDINLIMYRPSQIAAACLLAARLEHGVRPLWPKLLEIVTGYTVSDLQNAFNIIIDADIGHGRKRKYDETNESGYESTSPDVTTKRRCK